MHCDACKKLVTMELEDIGLDSSISQIDIADNVGTIMLDDSVSDSDIEKIKEVIGNMDDYEVV